MEISSANIFAVDTGFEPEKVAENYQEVINTFFGESQPVFNLVLLGLGDNSHTASLFPFTPVLADVSPSVKAVWLEEQKVFRLTLNAPLINLADNIAYLVYGKGKAEAVKHIIEDDTNYDLYPAQLIQPIQGSLAWFMDAEAAASLQKD